MLVSSRIQCAVIAIIVLPGWAAAQSALGSARSEVTVTGSQFSATAVMAPVEVDNATRSSDGGPVELTPLPPANLQADLIPASASDEATAGDASAPAGQAAVGGPTLAGATAGIRSNAAKENLTMQQLADRASQGHDRVGLDVALMIVGGAALIAGLLIGGGAGTAIAIGGAVVGLYGLFLYLR